MKRKRSAGKARDRVVFVLVDGIGDVALRSGKTPLQAATTPFLDRLACSGLNGLLDSVAPGLACGSDTSHMSIFGYAPHRLYRGRGAFECLGAGLEMLPGDVAFKSNFATVEERAPSSPATLQATPVIGRKVLRRRVDRNFPSWGKPLCDVLDGIDVPGFPHLKVACKFATEHRCGVSIRWGGKGSSSSAGDSQVSSSNRNRRLVDKVAGTDPLKDGRPLARSVPLDSSADAAFTSAAINAVSERFFEVLSSHPINVARREQGQPPANIVLLRGPGELLHVPTFCSLHGFIEGSAFMISPTCIIAGLGASLGMHVEKVEGATGDYHTDLSAKAAATARLFRRKRRRKRRDVREHNGRDAGEERQHGDRDRNFSFGFVHVKAVDDAGHDRSSALKREWLERCDAMVAEIAERLWKEEVVQTEDDTEEDAYCDSGDYTIVVTGDHTTTVCTGDHSFEPVPFVICKLSRVMLGRQRGAELGSAAAADAATASSSGAASASTEEAIGGDSTTKSTASSHDVLQDTVSSFSEVDAARGALGRFCGSEVMHLIKGFAEAGAGAIR